MRSSLLCWAVLAVLVAASSTFAQQGTAQIGGKVADEQGAALPGVTILVTNEATGTFREVTSSEEGTYLASQLVPGNYKIVARLTGFRTVERSGLPLQVGTTLTINLSLAIGGIEETVTVAGLSPLVDTSSARVGGNIGTSELAELPAMNRNYFAAVALLPGVQFTPSNQMGNDTILASGQSAQGNNVTVDGGYNMDDALGATAGRASANTARGYSGIPGAHEHVRRGIRPGQWRHRQRRYQSGHESVQGRRLPEHGEQSSDLERLSGQAGQPAEANCDQTRLGRRYWWTDRQEQGALPVQPRTANRQSDPHASLPDAALIELLDD
jgi:hypothetical protein